MPPRKKAATGPTPVEDLRHEDTRANIPTGELAEFVPDEQTVPPVRWPGEPRSRLLLRLVDVGSAALVQNQQADLEAHRAAVTASSGAYADAFPAGYLVELRQDWPA